MSKPDHENTTFQDFERTIIYDIKDGDNPKLIKSMQRLRAIIESLPERHTIAMWLYDKVEEGPRFGMLYWPLNEDELPDPSLRPVTKDVHVTTKQYEDLSVITCSCLTDVPDGDIVRLLSRATEEIKKLHAKKLEDVSFSKVGFDDLFEKAILKIYCI